jgi:hypothetical protein
MAIDLKDYVDVAERIGQFKELYPEGSLQTLSYEVGDDLVVVQAAAYRTPDDVRPGIGTASEPRPGRTPYTRDSELMNAETSAWGRAIVAVGIATKRVASAEEVRNRAAEREEPTPSQMLELARIADARGLTLEDVTKGLKKYGYQATKERLLKKPPLAQETAPRPTDTPTAPNAPETASAAQEGVLP